MADIVGAGNTSVGGLLPAVGIGRLEYWRPTVDTENEWVGGTPTVSIFTSFDAWTSTNSDVQLQVAEDIGFVTIVHDSDLAQNENDIDGRLVSGLVEGQTYYLRARVKETTPSTYLYISPWTTPSTFSVIFNVSGAYAYITSNVGVTVTLEDYWAHYAYENVGVAADGTESVDYWAHYAYENVGLEYTPSGHVPQYIFEGDVSTNTPTPHLWFLRPSFGRAGDSILLVGQGFGDLQTTYTGIVEIDMGDPIGWQSVPVITWQTFPPSPDAYTGDRKIDQLLAEMDPQHTIIEIVVPVGSIEPGHPIRVRTDGA
jgi:hypothetical protein